MQRTCELDRAARDVLRESEVEVDAEEEEGDGVGVSDIDRLDVVVDSDHSHRVHNLESVVKTLLGCGRVTVHVIQMRLNLNQSKSSCTYSVYTFRRREVGTHQERSMRREKRGENEAIEKIEVEVDDPSRRRYPSCNEIDVGIYFSSFEQSWVTLSTKQPMPTHSSVQIKNKNHA